MKATFLERLNKIAETAQQVIMEEVSRRRYIVLFSETVDEYCTADIYNAITDFPYYGKYGFVDYADVKEIKVKDHGIQITGILKGNSYSCAVQVCYLNWMLTVVPL